MMDRMHELFLEFREEHGIYSARKMAKAQCLEEMMEDLTELKLTTEEKIDRVITFLELMIMKAD